MSLPIACVWWPHAPAGRTAANKRWLHHWTPYVTAAEAHPGLFFLAATGLEGLFVSQQGWAEALLQALGGGQSAAYLALGHHQQSLWALVLAAAFADQTVAQAPKARLVAAHPSAAVEQAAMGRVRLAALDLPARCLRAAAAMRVHTLAQSRQLSIESVQGHFGEPLACWLRALSRPSPPLSRQVPAAPVLASADLTHPTADSAQLLFLLKRLLGQAMLQARGQRRVVAALHLYVRYEGRTPPPPLLRRIEAARASCEEQPWLRLLQLTLAYTVLAAPASAVRLRAEVVAPPACEQLLLWPAAAASQMRSACEALAKVQSAWGTEAVTVAQLLGAHLPEEQFVWRPWRGEPLPVAKPRAQRATAPTAQGRAPRVRLCWPRARPVPAHFQHWLRQQPRRLQQSAVALPIDRPGGAADASDATTAAGLVEAPGGARAAGSLRPVPLAGHGGGAPQQTPPGWLCGPFVFNLYWWTEQPCDRDYWYARMGPDEAVLWLYFDRRQRLWRWQGQLD